MSDEERKHLGDNSYRIAANFAPECFGKGLERAASVAMGVPQKRFGVMDRALLLVTAIMRDEREDPVAAYFDKLPEDSQAPVRGTRVGRKLQFPTTSGTRV